jgi:hypothetical protein
VTDVSIRAVSSLPALTSLDLAYCCKATDEGMRAVSNLPTLTFLNLTGCEVTDAGVRAVSRLPALTSLNLSHCTKVTDEVLRAVSGLTGLTSLNLRGCTRVTAAGVQALRSTRGSPPPRRRSRSLHAPPSARLSRGSWSLSVRLSRAWTRWTRRPRRATTTPSLHIKF